MHFAIIDDLEADRLKLSNALNRYLTEQAILLDNPIVEYENGESFLADFAQVSFDIIFIDMYMNGITGLEVAKKIRETDEECHIIFTTTSRDFAIDSYTVSASYYLVKPYSYEMLAKALSTCKIAQILANRYITLNDTPILLRDIVYTDFHNRHLYIYLKNQQVLTFRITLEEFFPKLLNYPNFRCCNRGSVVNLDEVARLEDCDFVMQTGARIPISRRHFAELRTYYFNYLFYKVREQDVMR